MPTNSSSNSARPHSHLDGQTNSSPCDASSRFILDRWRNLPPSQSEMNALLQAAGEERE